jgi:hypothetical protein
MSSSQAFVYKHRIKLAWKLVRHGMGVAFMTEEREGAERFKSGPKTWAADYIEIPSTH